MPDNYQLVTSQSTVQVLSPTVVQDAVVATIQTEPHGVIADYWLTQDEWDEGAAPDLLTAYAANIEQIMDDPHVLSAASGRSLDASGLVQSELTVTVGYSTPGSSFPPATVDVTIPANLLKPNAGTGSGSGVAQAVAMIDAAYAQLAAAAGAPQPAPLATDTTTE